MSTNTSIEWATKTWGPVLGCKKVSAGCDNCYAIRTAHRLASNPHPKISAAYANLTEQTEHGLDWTGVVRTLPERLGDPLKWRKAERIFVNSQSDLFHPAVKDEFLAQVWQVMGMTPHHTYQVLTKRPARMLSFLTRWYSGEIPEPYDVRTVPGYPGYSVTTLGEVLGKRMDTRGGLALQPGEQGHLRVTLYRDGSPRGLRELVHRLVLTAFVRPPRPGEQACHRNGNPADNRLSNLYWGTQEDNWRDRVAHGHGRSYSKLTEEQVDEVRRRAAQGEPAYRIAKDFPVSDTQVRNIVSGRHWSGPTPLPDVRSASRAVLSSVWIGVSVEDQATADTRIPKLLQIPAAVRWISAEPLLGYVRINKWVDRLDWIITGGESGPGSRPAHPSWFRSLRDICRVTGTPYLHKQHGAWTATPPDEREPELWLRSDGETASTSWGANGGPAGTTWAGMYRVGKKLAGRELDGVTHDAYPQAVTS